MVNSGPSLGCFLEINLPGVCRLATRSTHLAVLGALRNWLEPPDSRSGWEHVASMVVQA